MSEEEEIERQIAKIERERIKILLLEGKVDEAFDLMEKSIKRRIIEKWLKSEEEKHKLN